MPLEPGRYRHYKGNFYQVLRTARHSETEEELVVYFAVAKPEQWWVRPLAMFTESVTLPSGETVPRFEHQPEPAE